MYNVKGLGYNYRMTDFQASLGYHQLLRFKENLIIRKRNAKIYEKYLVSTKIKFKKFNEECSYFIYQIFVKNRDKLIKLLKKKYRIKYSLRYTEFLSLITIKNMIIKRIILKTRFFIVSKSISLPVHHQINKKHIKEVSKIILDFLKGK